MPGLKINWSINFGEILTLVSMLGVVGVFLFTLDKRISINTRDIEVLKTDQAAAESRAEKRFERVIYEIRENRKAISQKADR